ncbi:MAG: hypothetical protein AMXMBFR58_01260 [Phycisphaerae bacterium]|nr:hypothetical protein [Phycisphaerales bacterium]
MTPRHTHAPQSLGLASDPDGGEAVTFSHAQLQALADARAAARPVRRAAAAASLSGWSLAVFSGITSLGVLLGDLGSLLMGAALGVVAFNELRGAAMLRRFEPRGAKLLGWNQLGLGALLVLYAAWSLWTSLSRSGLESVGGSTGDPNIDGLVTGLSRTISIGVYGTLGAVGVIVPGLTAWYYFSRGRVVEAFVRRSARGTIAAVKAAA